MELPPINNCYHSLSDSSIPPTNCPQIKSHLHQRALFTDPLVGAEGEIEDHYFHNESDPTLAVSSVSIIQQPNSCAKLETQHSDESGSSPTDESWMYPYPHFQISSFTRYDKMTREQLLSSKAHALGLLSSKNWIKSKKNDQGISSDTSLSLARIRSSPGRTPKELLHGSGNFVPKLEGVNENVHACNGSRKVKDCSSKATSVTDTIHNRLKTAGAGVGHTTCTAVSTTTQSRPIYTSQGNKPQRATSNTRQTRPQTRKQHVASTSRTSHHPRKQLVSIRHHQQLSSSYIGQVNERLQGILKVKHENSPNCIRKSSITAT